MKKLPERGFVLVHPGLTEMMQDDFTNVISMFKAEGVQIVTGCPITPDFATFTTQAAQQGFKYEIMQMGRAYLFPSDVESVGKLSDGLLNEVWWSPWHPWESSLDGFTCQELADMYEMQFDIPWSAPMGYKYAGMEIAVNALKRAASLDPVKIRDAIRDTDMKTMVGPIKYELMAHGDLPPSYVSLTPIVGGQWTWDPRAEVSEINIVYNETFPEVPLNGTLRIPKR
jgi:branched-chain amino acid transport system substrate-binding protein